MNNSSENMHTVFVYGTLQREEPNFTLMIEPSNGVADFKGVGVTTEKRPLIIASEFNVPFLLDVVGVGQRVQGELFDVDDRMLAAMDELEAHPKLYERIIIDVEVDKENKLSTEKLCVQAWCYLLRDFKSELLQHSKHLNRYNKSIALEMHKPYLPRYVRNKTAQSLEEAVKSQTEEMV